jgi:hypothetical protein
MKMPSITLKTVLNFLKLPTIDCLASQYHRDIDLLIIDHNNKKIKLHNKLSVIEKQIRYGVDNIYIRYYNVIKNVPCRDSSSLNSFIHRYGDILGVEMHAQRCIDIATTLESFQKKYGEKIGQEKYTILISKRGLSEKNYIRLYGKIEGAIKFREYWDNTGFGTGVRHAKKRDGESSAIKTYDDLCKKMGDSRTLSGYKERYGDERGESLYTEHYALKHKNSSVKVWGKKLQMAEGLTDTELKEKIKWRFDTQSLQSFEKRYGHDIGLEKYLKNVQKHRLANPLSPEHYYAQGISTENSKEMALNELVTRFKSIPASNVSKESLRCLLPICDIINESNKSSKIFIGSDRFTNTEYLIRIPKIYREKHQKIFLYDMAIPDMKLIIEYHGARYHKDLDYKTTFLKYEDVCHEKDLFKKWIAEQAGFKVIVIRSWAWREDKFELYNYLNNLKDISKWKMTFLTK